MWTCAASQKMAFGLLFINQTLDGAHNFASYMCHLSPGQIFQPLSPFLLHSSGLKIQDCPPELPESGADSIYSYENLPSKHQKKYVYASRFVQLVRAKTPKVTYYSAKAKCDLMEHMEHFEMAFYDGSKIVRSDENNVTIVDGDGNSTGHCSVDGNEKARALFMHYHQCFEHCKLLEQALSNIQCEGERFPVIIGRRPASAPVLNSSKNHSNNLLTTKLPNVSAQAFVLFVFPSPMRPVLIFLSNRPISVDFVVFDVTE